MPRDAVALVLLFHLIGALFMAAPLYMLILVNERGRFKVPPSYNTDRYLENIIKGQPVRCYAYLGIVLVTGALLIYTRWAGWPALLNNWALWLKVGAFAVIVGTLSYVHLGIQPRIEAIFADCPPNGQVPEERRPGLMALRTRRKRLSTVCLALVLTAFIMGVKVTFGYSLWLAVLLLALSVLFAWRVYKTPVRLGWF